MAKIKKIKGKLGTRAVKNKYLLPDGSFDLIEKFPTYKDEKKGKVKG